MTERQQEALVAAHGIAATPKNLDRLARTVGVEDARWAFLQWELRARARAKFERADEMLFTRSGLEMATAKTVAEYHASLFPIGVVVADLTCGIGGDTIALAKRGPVIAFDRDAVSAECCRHNLEVYGLDGDVRNDVADVSSLLDAGVRHFFLDPARRNESGRVRSLSRYEPDPAQMADLLGRADLALVKLSPMLTYEELSRLSRDVTFVSNQWECCESLVRLGSVSGPRQCAVSAETGEALDFSSEDWECEAPDSFVFEADPAATKAHALGGLGLSTLGTAYGFLTGPDLIDSVWLRSFRTHWHGSFRLSAVQEALNQLGAKLDSVKVRKVDVDPIKVKKSMKPGGDALLTLLVYPHEKRILAVLMERL